MNAILSWLRPSPRIPQMPWSASGSYWRAGPGTIAILVLGLVLFGIGEGALVAAKLGTTPWTVLAQGVARHTPLDLGAATIAISAVVLLGWIPLRQRPGLGTLANLVVIGLALDAAARVLPSPHPLALRLLQVAAGILVVALGSALYLTANMGPGPRDGWMTGIHRITGLGIATVRTGIEVSVVLLGIALGGHFGVATVAFALLMGYALAALLRVLVAVTGERAGRVPTPAQPAAAPE